MTGNNQFGAGSQYTTTVQFGNEGHGQPSSTLPGDLIKDTTTASFPADVIQESRKQPVLVDFWAPWCGPCRQLGPVLEKVVQAAGGQVKLVKMNIDDHPAIAGQLGIQSIPAVLAFKDGQPVDGFMGAVPESQISEFIARLGGKAPGEGALEEVLATAAEALAQGDMQKAADIYGAVLQQDPTSTVAAAGLANILFEAGAYEDAQTILDGLPQDRQAAPEIAAVRTRLLLAAQAAELGDAAGLEQRLAENPADHQARFDLAMIQNAKGEKTQAADNLMAIIKADRDWNEDGARTQLLQFFEAWGMSDPATLAARRKLSSVLFS
ncbi:thioredoxin [Aquamicrobium segne]|uniref:Thioredoxin n=1 Tax=Aquamicrobium segne TaxID=469547 RepID=A0ABW0H211_9HYPH